MGEWGKIERNREKRWKRETLRVESNFSSDDDDHNSDEKCRDGCGVFVRSESQDASDASQTSGSGIVSEGKE